MADFEFRFAMNGKRLYQEDLNVINDMRSNTKFKTDALKGTASVFENIGSTVSNENDFASSVSSLIDEDTAKGLFRIFDTNNDEKLSSSELKPLRNRKGKVDSSSMWNHLAGEDSVLAHEAGTGTVLAKTDVKKGEYISGQGSAETAVPGALSKNKRLLPLGEQLELLKKIGVNMEKRNEKETAFYKSAEKNKAGELIKTDFYKVYDDSGMKKVVHSVMDKNGNVQTEIFRVENYTAGKKLNADPAPALKMQSKNRIAKTEPDTEYTYTASGKKLNVQAIQLLKDIHNNKNVEFKRTPIQIKIGSESKSAEEFADSLSSVLNDKQLSAGLFGILDKNGDGTLDKNELKVLKTQKRVTSNDLWRITSDNAVSAKKLITSGAFPLDSGKTEMQAVSQVFPKNANLLSRSAQIKQLESLGIDVSKSKKNGKERAVEIETDKGTEVYRVFEDRGIHKVVHSVIDKDNNELKFEVYNVYKYSKEKKMSHRNETEQQLANPVRRSKNGKAKRRR